MDRYRITQDTWNKLAMAYQEKFMDLDIYDHTYNLFLQKLPDGATVLEIGCGPGNITKYLLNNRTDLRLTGIDTSPEMIRLAEINNPAAMFSVMDCRELGEKMMPACHGIMCGFCLPYLSKEDVDKLILDASQLLHPGGVIYLSMIEDQYAKSGLETSAAGHVMQVYYHEEAHILNSLRKSGFTVSDVVRVDYPLNMGPKQVHLVVMATKES